MGISALVCGSAGTDNAESTALGFGKGVDSEGGRACVRWLSLGRLRTCGVIDRWLYLQELPERLGG